MQINLVASLRLLLRGTLLICLSSIILTGCAALESNPDLRGIFHPQANQPTPQVTAALSSGATPNPNAITLNRNVLEREQQDLSAARGTTQSPAATTTTPTTTTDSLYGGTTPQDDSSADSVPTPATAPVAQPAQACPGHEKQAKEILDSGVVGLFKDNVSALVGQDTSDWVKACELAKTGASIATMRAYAKAPDPQDLGDINEFNHALDWMQAGYNGKRPGFSERDAEEYENNTGECFNGESSNERVDEISGEPSPSYRACAFRRARDVRAAQIAWQHTGFSKTVQASWIKADFAAEAATAWATAGFSPAQAHLFAKRLGLSPSVAATVQSQCPDGVGIDTLTSTNPYDAKGHCYSYSSTVIKLLSRTQVAAMQSYSNPNIVIVEFAPDSAPADNSDFKVIVKVTDVDTQNGAVPFANVIYQYPSGQ